MNQTLVKPDGPTLRSRQQKRSSPEIRPVKRLFTPEIKRHLKSWLVRRRKNPYPNREEKIELSAQTGLTYIQICNWFANWRRKLKNSGKNVDEFTWSTLIKSYNDQALGNVEHLSISSDDSIWEEAEMDRGSRIDPKPDYPMDHCYSTFPQGAITKTSNEGKANHPIDQTGKSDYLPQCFQISSTTDFLPDSPKPQKRKRNLNFPKKTHFRNRVENKTKKSFRDKNWNYRRLLEGLEHSAMPRDNNTDSEDDDNRPRLGCDGRRVKNRPKNMSVNPATLSKWKKSAALFRPSCKTYSNSNRFRREMRKFKRKCESFHGREELDAAEALTFLSRASASK